MITILSLLIILSLFPIIWGYLLVFISFFKKEKNNKIISKKDNKFTTIICAHNEDIVIERLIKSLLNQTYKENDIYVILDNCTDKTKDIILKYKKAKIIVKDIISTCKADALNYGIKYLKKADLLNEIIVVLDADSTINKDFYEKLNKKYQTGSKVVMCSTKSLNPYDSLTTKWYTIYWEMISSMSRQAHNKLNLSSNISGCGISLRKEYLYETKTITEDVEYFIKLTNNNIKVDYLKDISVYQEQPTTLKCMFKQLYRWVNGIRKVNKLYFKQTIKSLTNELNIMKLDGILTSLTCTSMGITTIIIFILFIYSLFLNKFSLFLIILIILILFLTIFTGIYIVIKEKYKLSKMIHGILTYFIFTIFLGLIYDYAIIFPSNKWEKITRRGE